MSDLVIAVKEVSKRYRIGISEKRSDTIIGAFVQGLRSPIQNLRQIRNLSNLDQDEASVFWALRDVSFEVKQGEVLGIIGHNGAGKSTLLKILSRITEPTSGEIRISGRVAALLEVGTGFHPELTGRENVYMNGTILGMRKREIDLKLEEIVEFSGVRKHLDTPVKFYSSGMRVRLGFSVAANLNPEILIVDEVLAVGDAEFQKRCIGKMQDVSQSGKTVLFVSHNMAAVRSLCTAALILEGGRVLSAGDVDPMVNRYLSSGSRSADGNAGLLDREDIIGNKDVVIERVTFHNSEDDAEIHCLLSGLSIKIKLYYQCQDPSRIKRLHVAIAFSTLMGSESFVCDNFFVNKDLDDLKYNGVFEITILKWPLNSGKYKYRIHIDNDYAVAFRLENAGEVMVEYGDFFGTGYKVPVHLNGCFIEHEWRNR